MTALWSTQWLQDARRHTQCDGRRDQGSTSSIRGGGMRSLLSTVTGKSGTAVLDTTTSQVVA